MNPVPCNGCTIWCHGDAVRLLESYGDDSRYHTQPHPYLPGARMIAHQPNGDCVYLGPGGCRIHEYKPQMCREMDCRLIASRLTFTQARKLSAKGALRLPVWQRGRDLLRGPKP